MSELSRRGFLAISAVAAGALGGGIPVGEALRSGVQPSTNRVTPGADVLAVDRWRSLRGKRIGVLSNQTGVLTDLTHIVDDMVATGVKPVAIFGPEHGFRGTAQAGGSEVKATDPRTGITVYDAYAATVDTLSGMYREAGVDTVVFDIVNVGARFYTYTWSMYIAMRASVVTGAGFVVLDRPNPVGGKAFGPQLDPRYASGVGMKPIVQQPGLTSGELARLFDAEFLPADTGGKHLSTLDIVEVSGWSRNQLDTGLAWIPPSPNMPTQDTALVYPGTCMFEGTQWSTGRGTTRPFETIGAPGIDWRWAEALNAAELPGVRFRENYFMPTFDKFTGTTCGGVQLVVTDRERFDAIRTAVTMMVTAKRLYPGAFAWRTDNWIDKLTGSDRLRRMVDAGASADEVVGAWEPELAEFRGLRGRYEIYR